MLVICAEIGPVGRTGAGWLSDNIVGLSIHEFLEIAQHASARQLALVLHIAIQRPDRAADAFEFELAPNLRVVRVPCEHGGPERFNACVIEGTNSCAALVTRSVV